MFFKKRLKKSTPESEKAFGKMFEEENVGVKDKFAMILSAFLVIVIPCLLILCAISCLMLWVFRAF